MEGGSYPREKHVESVILIIKDKTIETLEGDIYRCKRRERGEISVERENTAQSARSKIQQEGQEEGGEGCTSDKRIR